MKRKVQTEKKKLLFGTKSEKHFIHYVYGKCKKHGIKVILKDVKYLKVDGIRCSGYFDDQNKILAVAMKSKNSKEIFVHEFGHVTQFIDNCLPWKNLGQSLEKVTDWLHGKRVHNINRHIDIVKLMELDNEKRSVELIKNFNLDIDVEDYIKRANSYIYFYNRLKKTRKWSHPKNAPYNNKSVFKVMPSYFKKSYKTTPKNVEKIYEAENI